MPHFENFYADKLRGSHGVAEADAVLDLRLVAAAEAMELLGATLEGRHFPQARTVAVRLAAPIPGGGQTLFQPVGRRLLDARRLGQIASLETLPAQDGLGFFIALAGKSGEDAPAAD